MLYPEAFKKLKLLSKGLKVVFTLFFIFNSLFLCQQASTESLFSDRNNFTLATIPGVVNPFIKRDILYELSKKQVIVAETQEQIKLLGINNGQCLLLGCGKYLVSEKIYGNDLMLLRAIIHEQVEALMQIIYTNDKNKYYSIKELIYGNQELISSFLFLKDHPHYSDNNFLLNDLIATALEIGVLVENGLVSNNSEDHGFLDEAEQRFYSKIKPIIEGNRHNYFSEGFYLTDEDILIRSEHLRSAISDGVCFYQTSLIDRNILNGKKMLPEDLIDNYRFAYVRNHASRVLLIAEVLGGYLGFSEDMLKKLRIAAAGHDFGAPYVIEPSQAKSSKAFLLKKGIDLSLYKRYDQDDFMLVKHLVSKDKDIDARTIDYALDYFQGPASLYRMKSEGFDVDTLSNSVKTAILFHHNINELEDYLNSQKWSLDEKEECRVMTYSLITSDIAENGMNLFKMAFFRNKTVVETPEEIMEFMEKRAFNEVKKQSLNNEKLVNEMLQAFSLFSKEGRVYSGIAKKAKLIDAEEYRDLQKIEKVPYRIIPFPYIYMNYESNFVRVHAERVEKIAVMLAEQMGISYENIRKIRFLASVYELGATKYPISKQFANASRLKFLNNGIDLPLWNSPDIEEYINLVNIFEKDREKQIYTDKEKSYALDLYRGPAVLDIIKKRMNIPDNEGYIPRSLIKAIQYHNNVEDLLDYFSSEYAKVEKWGNQEKEETLMLLSILSVADRVESDMNYFNKIFFEGKENIGTLEETISYINEESNLPKKNIDETLSALNEIKKYDEFKEIQTEAGQLSANEENDLSSYGLSWKNDLGETIDPRISIITNKIKHQVGSIKKIFFDLMGYIENNNEYFVIRYDADQLSPDQVTIIDLYVKTIKEKYSDPKKIQLRKFSGKRNKESKPLISVTRQSKLGKSTDILGLGEVDIVTGTENASDYYLDLPAMINIAMATSLLDKDINIEGLLSSYDFIQGYIKDQYKTIVGRDLSKQEIALLKMKRLIVLSLPDMYKMPLTELRRCNELLMKTLISA